MPFIIGQGGESDRRSIKLETKEGRWINNARRMELHPERMRAAEELCQSTCPGITTRSLSHSYNCYGMVFANRRTCIVDEREIGKILTDDGYRLVQNRAEVCCGDVIVYRKQEGGEIAHVGVIFVVNHNIKTGDREFVVLSQWGGDGEYIHAEEQVLTQFGDCREYYSERKLL